MFADSAAIGGAASDGCASVVAHVAGVPGARGKVAAGAVANRAAVVLTGVAAVA